MFQILFLIPLTDEDGDSFSEAHMLEWELYLHEQFASIMQLPDSFAHAFAAMLSGSTLDSVTVYLVTVDSLNGAPRAFAVLRYARAYFGRAWILVQFEPPWRH